MVEAADLWNGHNRAECWWRNGPGPRRVLVQDLEELLGRSVEVLTDAGLSPYLQERTLAEATAL
jgi:hypothetical protein